MKAAVIQTRTPATSPNGLRHVAPLVRDAAGKGATLILTPEGTNFLQKDRTLLGVELHAAKDDACVQGLIALAAELKVWIVIGSALVRGESGAAANRQFVIDPKGAVVATYDKLHMFDVDLPNGEKARESALYAPGDKAVVVRAGEATLGLTICYDVRFPALHRALAIGGAQILTMPAAFTRPTGEAHWSVLIRARAIETGSFVMAAAQGGYHEDGRGTYGRSMIVDPWGRVLGKLDHDEPGVLVADLNLDDVDTARNAIPALRNARAFTGPAQAGLGA
jgi:predicted amidohydrolase